MSFVNAKFLALKEPLHGYVHSDDDLDQIARFYSDNRWGGGSKSYLDEPRYVYKLVAIYHPPKKPQARFEILED